MTQEERIANLEQEISVLKDELKRNRKANVWKKIKDKFENDFNSFDWVYIHNTTNCCGEPITFKRDMIERYHVSQAIGTLVRITLKRKGLNYLEEQDIQKAEKITEEILSIMMNEKEMKTNEGKNI